MSSERLPRWSGTAAVFAPLFLLSFGSHTFWTYLGRARQTLGFADGTYIHPLIAAIGLMGTALVLAALYQRLPQQARPASTWLLRGGIAGVGLSLIGLLGFLFPAQGSLFAGVGLGLLLILVALAGMGYLSMKYKVLGVASFAPLAIVVTTFGLALTAGFDAPVPVDSPINQLFTVLYVLCWLLLGVALLAGTDAGREQPIPT